MNARELVDHIRSGPAKLVLDEPLRFRRRTRSNPCDFNEFLQALQSSETIRDVKCYSHQTLGITEDKWVLLVKTLGSIKAIQRLEFYCTPHNFCPFQAVADALNNARLLCGLEVISSREFFLRDLSESNALANALRGHPTLHTFIWDECYARQEAELQVAALDSVLRVLPACPHLRAVTIMTKCASADTINNLLLLRSAPYLCLVLDTDYWLAAADEIRQGRCLIKSLHLGMFQSSSSGTTENVKALASAIRLYRNLEYLYLQLEGVLTMKRAWPWQQNSAQDHLVR